MSDRFKKTQKNRILTWINLIICLNQDFPDFPDFQDVLRILIQTNFTNIGMEKCKNPENPENPENPDSDKLEFKCVTSVIKEKDINQRTQNN